MAELDELGSPEAEYTQEPAAYGNLISQTRSAESSFYHYDALGSTRELTDSAEVISDDYIYKPFGSVESQSGTTTNPYQWVGQQGYYRDTESDYYSVDGNTYGPKTGRWLSQNPQPAPSRSLYEYSGNNPTNTDLSLLKKPPKPTSVPVDIQEEFRRILRAARETSKTFKPRSVGKFDCVSGCHGRGRVGGERGGAALSDFYPLTRFFKARCPDPATGKACPTLGELLRTLANRHAMKLQAGIARGLTAEGKVSDVLEEVTGTGPVLDILACIGRFRPRHPIRWRRDKLDLSPFVS